MSGVVNNFALEVLWDGRSPIPAHGLDYETFDPKDPERREFWIDQEKRKKYDFTALLYWFK